MRDVVIAVAADDSCLMMFMVYGYMVSGIINVCIFFRVSKLFFKCKNGACCHIVVVFWKFGLYGITCSIATP